MKKMKRRNVYVSLLLILSLLFATFGIPMASATVNSSNNIYEEDFTNLTIGASNSGAEWAQDSSGPLADTIVGGQITRTSTSNSVSRTICNAFPVSGSYVCSFDMNEKLTYTSPYVSVFFNYIDNKNYYELRFIARIASAGLPANSLSLIKRNNSTTDTVLTSVYYPEIAYDTGNYGTFHIDLAYEADPTGGYITVDSKNLDNGHQTRVLDRFHDTTSAPTAGKIAVGGKTCTYWFDNFVIVKDTYRINKAVYYTKGNQIRVKADAIVPLTNFNSATIVAAAYTANGKLVAVKSKPYAKADLKGAFIWYEDVLDTQGASVSKVKVMLIDAFETMKPNFSSPVCIADYMGDINDPDFVPADVVRSNVPQEVSVIKTGEDVPVMTSIPNELSTKVYRTYPDGKYKAFVLSFDDGSQQAGSTADHDLMVPYLKEKGLKAAFNLNMPDAQRYDAGGFVIGTDPDTGAAINAKSDPTGGLYRDEMNKLYKDPNFEVACHTLNHITVSNLSKQRARRELGESKNFFETLLDQEVAGFVEPGGGSSDPVVATPEWRMAYMKNAGYRYIRHAPMKYPAGAGTAAEFYFHVPPNFLDWSPTMKVSDDSAGVDRVAVLQAFLDLDPQNTMKLFFGWGHGWEMKNNPASFVKFQSLCDLAVGNFAAIWNPTPIQYVDYVNASRLVQVTSDAQGNIIAYNPSAEITVWLEIRGVDTPIAPGETVVSTDDVEQAKLSALTYAPNGGSALAVPGFESANGGGTYAVSVPFGTTSVSVEATVADASATLTENPVSGVVDLTGGSGIYTAAVTAGQATNIYTINFTVLPPVYNAQLSALTYTPTGGSAQAVTDFTTEDEGGTYEMVVPDGIDSVSVGATAADGSAAITMNPVNGIVNLTGGNASCIITVVSGTKTNVFTIYFKVGSSNAKLSSLTYSVNYGSSTAVTGFLPGNDGGTYTVTLPIGTSIAAINGITADAAANVVYDKASLDQFPGSIKATVTAEDGSQKVYTVYFNLPGYLLTDDFERHGALGTLLATNISPWYYAANFAGTTVVQIAVDPKNTANKVAQYWYNNTSAQNPVMKAKVAFANDPIVISGKINLNKSSGGPNFYIDVKKSDDTSAKTLFMFKNNNWVNNYSGGGGFSWTSAAGQWVKFNATVFPNRTDMTQCKMILTAGWVTSAGVKTTVSQVGTIDLSGSNFVTTGQIVVVYNSAMPSATASEIYVDDAKIYTYAASSLVIPKSTGIVNAGAVDVYLDQYEYDGNTLNKDRIIVKAPDNTIIPIASVDMDPLNTNKFTLHFANGALLGSTTYTVTLDAAVKDLAGNPITNTTSFITAAF